MNALSASILFLLVLVTSFAPRRWALLAMLAGVFFLTQGHSINVAGLNIYPVRVLSACGFIRVGLRRELSWSRLNRVDWTLLLLYNYTAFIWIVRSRDIAAQQFGYALDPTLCYLAFRGLIKSLDDVRWLWLAIAFLLAPFTALVALERITGQSSFQIVGNMEPLILRDGVARCMGSFRHAIL